MRESVKAPLLVAILDKDIFIIIRYKRKDISLLFLLRQILWGI